MKGEFIVYRIMNLKKWAALSLVFLLFFTIAVSRISGTANASTEKGEKYIVLFQDNADVDSVVSELSLKHNFKAEFKYKHAVKGFAGTLPPGIVDKLKKDPRIRLIEKDLPVQAYAQTLPTGVNRIEADLNTYAAINGLNDVNLDIDIAIIDTGIDRDHPDLNVVSQQSFISDRYSDDGNGHGTHVAGIAAAKDNGSGVVGVAPGARLHAVKVLNYKGQGTTSSIMAGVDWVTDNAATIDIANMSLGGQGASTALHDAIKASVAKGVFYCVAAGNENADVYGPNGQLDYVDDFFPACFPEVATISAMVDTDGKPGGLGPATSYGGDDTYATFSNFGEAVDLMLPGMNILSTWNNGLTNTLSGTSMASPHAAGLAALYYISKGASNGDLNGDGIKNGEDVAEALAALKSCAIAQSDPKGLNDLNHGKTSEKIGWADWTAGGSDNSAPVANNDAATTDKNKSVIISVLSNDTDADNDILVVSEVSNGANGIVTISADSKSVIYTPNPNFTGMETFTYKASDGTANSNSATVTVNVVSPNLIINPGFENSFTGWTTSGNPRITTAAKHSGTYGADLYRSTKGSNIVKTAVQTVHINGDGTPQTLTFTAWCRMTSSGKGYMEVYKDGAVAGSATYSAGTWGQLVINISNVIIPVGGADFTLKFRVSGTGMQVDDTALVLN
jgi:subtilisin family serine protease